MFDGRNGAVQGNVDGDVDPESVKQRLVAALGAVPEQSPPGDTTTLSAGPNAEEELSSTSVSGEPTASDTSQDDGFTPPDDVSEDHSNSTVEDQVASYQEILEEDGDSEGLEEVEDAATDQARTSIQQDEEHEEHEQADEAEAAERSRVIQEFERRLGRPIDDDDRQLLQLDQRNLARPGGRIADAMLDYQVQLMRLAKHNKARDDSARRKQQEEEEETRDVPIPPGYKEQVIELEKRNRARLVALQNQQREEEQAARVKANAEADRKNEHPTSTAVDSKTKECAILVRLTDGSTLRARFPCSSTINGTIRPWIDENRTDIPTPTSSTTRKTNTAPYTIKHFLTPHPNRVFSASEEESTSLEELGLYPSATLVVTSISKSTDAYSAQNGGGVVTKVFSAGYNTVSGFLKWMTGILWIFLGLGSARTQPEGESSERGSKEGKNEKGNASGSSSGDANVQARSKANASASARSRGIRITTLQDQREREERERSEGMDNDDDGKDGRRRQFYNGNQVCPIVSLYICALLLAIRLFICPIFVLLLKDSLRMG